MRTPLILQKILGFEATAIGSTFPISPRKRLGWEGCGKATEQLFELMKG